MRNTLLVGMLLLLATSIQAQETRKRSGFFANYGTLVDAMTDSTYPYAAFSVLKDTHTGRVVFTCVNRALAVNVSVSDGDYLTTGDVMVRGDKKPPITMTGENIVGEKMNNVTFGHDDAIRFANEWLTSEKLIIRIPVFGGGRVYDSHTGPTDARKALTPTLEACSVTID